MIIPIPSPRPLLRCSVSVIITAFVWIAAVIAAIVLGDRYGLFDRPSLNGASVLDQVLAPQVAAVEALLVIALVVWLTKNRPHIDPADIGATRADARYVLGIATVYGLIAIMGGVVLGTAMGTYPFSFHLPGTLIGAHTHDLVTPMQTWVWSLYNLIAYVAVPMLYMRHGFPGGRSFLGSNNLAGDVRLILVVLLIESLVQLAALSDAVLELGASEMLIGAPLTFVIYLLGTGLPTMYFVQAIIVPRLLVVSGSTVTAVILGGVAYTLMHMPESWMTYASAPRALLSVIFLFFTYFFAGMVKATITLRTGNAWAHMWAYHAIAPHVLIDTPLIVAVFAI